MSTVRLELPPKLVPVFEGAADIRGAYGGRGSGKTMSFAKMTAVRAYMWGKAGREGLIVGGRQFMNSLEDSSMAEIKAAILSEPWLSEYFDIGEKYIRTTDGRIHYSFVGLNRNVGSIKSKAKILLFWVDEAEPVPESVWQVLIPTLRQEDSELWVTWNPARKVSATHKRFREAQDPRMKVIQMNWRDNPWWPDILERTRLKDKEERPDSYEHIWEGDFVTVVEGAYFAKYLTEAKAQNRISRVSADPLMTIRIFCDIGGTGAKADAFTMWAAQFIGREIRVLNYYESVGQPLASHLDWLRSNGYTPEKAQIWLPHDGDTQDKVFDVSYRSALESAGYSVTVVANQGKGAAKARIEAARRLFPMMWFNESTTEGGRGALGWYHEKRDDERGIGLGPNHDWSSHGCFHPDTKVLARYGTCRIMDLPLTGEVLTPCGWKQYINPRITNLDAPLVEVRFVGGYSVKCTPDHLFLTESGWKSAERLTKDIVIQSSLTGSRNISRALFTVCGQVSAILQKVASDCIVKLGLRHSGLYPRDAISTTETGISQIIVWKILNVLTLQSIYALKEALIQCISTVVSVIQLGKKPPSGINPSRGGSGIEEWQSERRDGPNGSVKRSPALNAVLNLKRWLGKVATRRYIARPFVKSLRIESVSLLSERASVWDITVPDGHWFSLENGAVVHNSDSFGLMCVAYEQPSPNAAKPIVYKTRRIA